MSDGKVPMPADGGGTHKGAPDGVNNAGDPESGRGSGQGDPYPNPHTGKKPQDGFMGHGGQTNLEDRSKSGEEIDETE